MAPSGAARANVSGIQAARVIEALQPDRLARLTIAANRFDLLANSLAKSRERTAVILSREPWPDPSSRDQREVANTIKDAIDAADRRQRDDGCGGQHQAAHCYKDRRPLPKQAMAAPSAISERPTGSGSMQPGDPQPRVTGVNRHGHNPPP